MNDAIKEIVKLLCGAVVGGVSAVVAYHWTGWKLSSEQNLYIAPVLLSSNHLCDIDQDKLIASWKSYKAPLPPEEAAYNYFSTLPKDDPSLKEQIKQSFPAPLREHLEKSDVFKCSTKPGEAIVKSIDKDTIVEIGIGMRERTDYIISRACKLLIGETSVPLLIETGGGQPTLSPRPIQVVELSKTQSFVAVVSKMWDKKSLPVASPAKATVKCKVLTPNGFRWETGEGDI